MYRNSNKKGYGDIEQSLYQKKNYKPKHNRTREKGQMKDLEIGGVSIKRGETKRIELCL